MHYLILLLLCAFNAYGLSPLEALYKENDCGNSNYNFSHNKIAVVDSGFDGEHSLLKNNLKQS